MTRHYGRHIAQHNREWTAIYEQRVKDLVAALRRLHDEVAGRFGSEFDMSPELRDAVRVARAALDFYQHSAKGTNS